MDLAVTATTQGDGWGNTGFKSGGFNASSPGSAPYRPETLDAYETGVKMDLLDRRVRLNAAVFYYNYNDIQVQTLVNSLADVINGAKARVTGLDADFAVQVTPEFSLTGGLGWIDPIFTSFNNCPFSRRAVEVTLPLLEALKGT
jgi:iron complex outermembrane receptor protein